MGSKEKGGLDILPEETIESFVSVSEEFNERLEAKIKNIDKNYKSLLNSKLLEEMREETKHVVEEIQDYEPESGPGAKRKKELYEMDKERWGKIYAVSSEIATEVASPLMDLVGYRFECFGEVEFVAKDAPVSGPLIDTYEINGQDITFDEEDWPVLGFETINMATVIPVEEKKGVEYVFTLGSPDLMKGDEFSAEFGLGVKLSDFTNVNENDTPLPLPRPVNEYLSAKKSEQFEGDLGSNSLYLMRKPSIVEASRKITVFGSDGEPGRVYNSNRKWPNTLPETVQREINF